MLGIIAFTSLRFTGTRKATTNKRSVTVRRLLEPSGRYCEVLKDKNMITHSPSSNKSFLEFSINHLHMWPIDLWQQPPRLPGKVGLLFAIQDVTESMCGAADRAAESTQKRKENKEREETEALRCAWYPISSQYPSQEWKNTMNEIHCSNAQAWAGWALFGTMDGSRDQMGDE